MENQTARFQNMLTYPTSNGTHDDGGSTQLFNWARAGSGVGRPVTFVSSLDLSV